MSMNTNASLPNERSGGKFWIPILCFLVSAGAMLAAMALFGMSPFGGKTLFIADMKDQYAHFHAYLRHVLFGDQSPLYSTMAGLGTNMLPLFTYYLSSPLALLTLLFPASLLPEALLAVTVVKVGLIGAAYAIFARRVLDARRSSLVFAPFFALCGFAMCYASNIMWLDTLILLPLVLCGAHALVTRRRWGGLFFGLLALFFTQFYLAYMAGIFTLLCFLGMLWVHKPTKPLRILLAFGATTIGAALCCAATLLPSALQLFSNAGAAGFEVNASWVPAFPFEALFARSFLGGFDTIQASIEGAAGLPPIYCGTLVLLLMPVYFFNSKIAWRERMVIGVVSALLMLSFWLPALTLFWHAFDGAAWFQFRYTFLLSFLWVWAAHRCAKRAEGIRPWCVLLSGALALVYVTVIHPNTFTYTPALARTITPWLIGLWTLVVLWVRLAPKARRVAVLLCAVLVLAEAGGNAYFTLLSLNMENHYLARDAFAEKFDSRAALIAQLPQEAGDPYRVDSDTSAGKNDSLTLGYNALQFYSSTASRELGNALMRLGMGGLGLIYVHAGSNIALDSLLGIRYLMEPEAPNAYYVPVAEQDGVTAFQNDYAFPLAFGAPSTVLDYRLPAQRYEATVYGDTLMHTDTFALQNGLFAALGQEVFLPLPIEETEYIGTTSTTLPEGGEALKVSDTAESSPEIPGKRMVALTQTDGPVYLYFAQYKEDGAGQLFWEDGDSAPVYTMLETEAPSVAYLDDFGPDEEIPLVFQMDGESVRFSCQAVNQLDMAALDELYNAAWASQMNDLVLLGNRISGTVDVVDGRDTLLLTLPYDGGWQATVNETPTPVERGLDLFCAVPLSEGRNYVKLTYTPPGLVLGLWLSACGILGVLIAAAAGMLLSARRRKAAA